MEEMALIREIASEALAEREKVQIKVRQPLRELRIGVSKLKIKNKELIEVLEEEVNVKTVIFEEKSDKLVQLDTEITSELKEEGMFRELIRAIQQMRAKANLLPSDKIILGIKAEKEILEIIEKNKESFKDSIGAEDLIFSDMADLPIIKETTKIGTEEILATIWKGKKTHESDS